MYIQNAIYKNVPAGNLTFPLAAGTLVTRSGEVTTGENAYGIVPVTITNMPTTKEIYVAVAGDIDLTSPANAGVAFSTDALQALGGDFNFVPNVESGGGGSSLPPVTDADNGDVLTVVNGAWDKAAPGNSLPPFTDDDADKAIMVVVPESTVIPAQTIDFTNGYGTAVGVDFSSLEIGDEITFTGTALGQPITLTGVVVQDGANLMISLGDDYFKVDGSAYISEIESIPSVSVDADAVTVTGDANASWNFPALVVKAKGTATKSGSTSYTITVGVDISAEKIAECFTPDKARPVFVLLPVFSSIDPYYDYETANRMFLLENSSESYLFGDVSAAQYCKYDGTNNTLVYFKQASV